MAKNSVGQCLWCDKPAFANLKTNEGERPICLDHYIQLQGVENERQRNLSDLARQQMAMANVAMDEMQFMTGLPAMGPRIAIPTPTPVAGHNSITVSNSTIGVLSTAAVGQISSYVGAMPRNDAARAAIEQFTSAVANTDMDEGDRKDLLDQIAIVAEQAATKPEHRKPSVVKPMLAAITQAAAATSALAGAWTAVEPILRGYFGF